MNNLTQSQKDAKQAVLDRQMNEMVERYKQADSAERKVVIGHIDSFLPITRSESERIFWLKFREKLERMNEQN